MFLKLYPVAMVAVFNFQMPKYHFICLYLCGPSP